MHKFTKFLSAALAWRAHKLGAPYEIRDQNSAMPFGVFHSQAPSLLPGAGPAHNPAIKSYRFT